MLQQIGIGALLLMIACNTGIVKDVPINSDTAKQSILDSNLSRADTTMAADIYAFPHRWERIIEIGAGSHIFERDPQEVGRFALQIEFDDQQQLPRIKLRLNRQYRIGHVLRFVETQEAFLLDVQWVDSAKPELTPLRFNKYDASANVISLPGEPGCCFLMPHTETGTLPVHVEPPSEN
jgi:hypothetical protein